jgi:Undecaprenyl-phosphate glucose phosphotransferase
MTFLSQEGAPVFASDSSVSTEDLLASEPRRPARNRASIFPLIFVFSFQIFDVLAPILIGYVCYEIYDASGPTFWTICGKFCVVAALIAALLFQLAGCYRQERLLDGRDTLRSLLTGFSWLVGLGLIAAFLSKSLTDVSRVWAVLWLLSWASASAGFRLWATRTLTAHAAKGDLYKTIAVVGATEWAEHLCTILSRHKVPPLRIVGVFDDRRERVAAGFVSSVRSVDELLELGRRVHIDLVVLALPLEAATRILEISRRVMALSVDIMACPDLRGLELLCRPVVSQAGMPGFRITQRPISEGHSVLKLASDKMVSLILLMLLTPMLLAIAFGIKCTSPGPVFFYQKRHGYNNRQFHVMKFRSMRVEAADASGGRQAQRNDSRATSFGRFLRRSSLDELPQLLNVLRGDMSLVGPRPLPIGMRTQDLYNHEIVEEYAHRHRVRPGITGWAQINGSRGATDVPAQLQKRVELDLYYIENWSLLFDLKILVLTVIHLLRPKNAF